MKKNMKFMTQKQVVISCRFIVISLFVFGFTFIFSSCEGYRCGNGIIYDSQTKEPIDSVKCTVLSACRDEIQYSDSLGHFELCNCFGGCVPDCPDIVIEFSKEGYKTQKTINPDKAKIYLDKE